MNAYAQKATVMTGSFQTKHVNEVAIQRHPKSEVTP